MIGHAGFLADRRDAGGFLAVHGEGLFAEDGLLARAAGGDDLLRVELVGAADGHDVYAGIAQERVHAGAVVGSDAGCDRFGDRGVNVHDVADFQDVLEPGERGKVDCLGDRAGAKDADA